MNYRDLQKKLKEYRKLNYYHGKLNLKKHQLEFTYDHIKKKESLQYFNNIKDTFKLFTFDKKNKSNGNWKYKADFEKEYISYYNFNDWISDLSNKEIYNAATSIDNDNFTQLIPFFYYKKSTKTMRLIIQIHYISIKMLKYEEIFEKQNASVIIDTYKEDIKQAVDNVIYQMNYYNEDSNAKKVITGFKLIYLKIPKKGGCNEHSSKICVEKIHKNKLRMWNLKSKNNNCLIMCFLKFLGIKGNEIKPDDIREKLGIPKNILLDYEIHGKILAEYFKLNLIFIDYNAKPKQIYFDPENDEKLMKIYLKNGHFYLIEESLERKFCKKCRTGYFNNHTCNIDKKSFVSHVMKKNKDILLKNTYACKKEIDYNTICFFDIETFGKEIGYKDGSIEVFQTYSIGWLIGDNYKMAKGKDCWNTFLDDILNKDISFLTAYNGSNFDNYPLLNELMKRKIKIKNHVLKNGSFLTIEFFNNNEKSIKTLDLCKFLSCSLDKACKNFKIKNAKSDFDHNLIKTWEDVDNIEHLWSPYLKLDCLALQELFITFNKDIYSQFNINITKSLTAPSHAFKLFNKVIPDNIEIEIPNVLDKYHYIRRSIYGGRTFPLEKYYKSKSITEEDIENYKKSIEKKSETEIDTIWEQFKLQHDFLFVADAVSLYSAAMRGTDFCKIEYPTGASRFSDNPEKDFYSKKIGFYEVDIICPKNLRFGYLPQKKENGNVGLDWNLKNKSKQVYTNIDLEDALSLGYKITKFYSALVYDSSSTSIFNEYVNYFYNLKKQATIDKNPVKRSIAKLYQNSLYGQLMMNAIFTKDKITSDINEIFRFWEDHKITEITKVHGKYIIKGESNIKEKDIKKPNQLGAFVLSYSRRLMLYFMKQIDPTLKSTIFHYTDTDSMFITKENYYKLRKIGSVPENEKLGYLSNDCDNDGIVIEMKALGPKSYFKTTLDKYGNINDECKSKGIRLKDTLGTKNTLLKKEMYIKEEAEETKFTSFKKCHFKLSSHDKTAGINPLSIKKMEVCRTFQKNHWTGMKSAGNQFLPYVC